MSWSQLVLEKCWYTGHIWIGYLYIMDVNVDLKSYPSPFDGIVHVMPKILPTPCPNLWSNPSKNCRWIAVMKCGNVKNWSRFQSSWCFGTMEFDVPIGNVIIPTDELIFFRGVETQNQHQAAQNFMIHWWCSHLSPSLPLLLRKVMGRSCRTSAWDLWRMNPSRITWLWTLDGEGTSLSSWNSCWAINGDLMGFRGGWMGSNGD